MRLLLDAQLSPARIGDPLAARGHDVLALDAVRELAGLVDSEVLRLAAEDERILIWSLSNRQHGAIIHAVAEGLAALPDPAAWRGLTLDI